MFTEILRGSVSDARGRRAQVADLAIDPLSGEHPTVTRLIYSLADRSRRSVSWQDVRHSVARPADLQVDDVGSQQSPSDQGPKSELLLKRDVMDALVLDLKERRALRVTDLALEPDGDTLRLAAMDDGFGAILRRLSAGRIGAGWRDTLHDWRYIVYLRGRPHDMDAPEFEHPIRHLPPGEIARLVSALPYLHAAELLCLLPEPVAANAMEAMSPERQLQVLPEMGEPRSSHLLELMRPDVVADLLGRLSPDAALDQLVKLSRGRRDLVVALLRYPENTAGGIMTNEIVSAPAGWTVAEARDRLREPLRRPDFVYFVYVIESLEFPRLLGVLTLRNLVTADAGSRLSDVMNPYLITISPLAAAAEAARLVVDSELTALPVVADDGRLLGAVTVDAALAIAAPESWRRESPRLFS